MFLKKSSRIKNILNEKLCAKVLNFIVYESIQKQLFNATLFFATLVFVAEDQTLKILTALNLYEPPTF